MILSNVKMALTGIPVNIRIDNNKIKDVLPQAVNIPGELNLTFENAIVFPGLINSHDHLDFNLFPALGNRIYSNYSEWGRYIHTHYKTEINNVLKVPEELRIKWGIYKNLLCGVTTVVNHGKKIKEGNGPVTVYQDAQSIHSVGFEKKWPILLNDPFKKNKTVIIHTGEGTDKASKREIDKLIRCNFLKRKLAGIHGVAMTAGQAKAFKALVWCPESNYFLLNKTAAIKSLKAQTTILFGTDSTLTGRWNIWDHIRVAQKTGALTNLELFGTLTLNPSKLWNIKGGKIAEGLDADIVIAKSKKNNSTDAFFGINPGDILLVLHKGKVVLADEEAYTQLPPIMRNNYSKIIMNGNRKYVTGDLPGLMEEIGKYYPDACFPCITAAS